MAFELRLTFKGLTALVPREKADGTATGEWLVVIPNLKQGAYLMIPKDKQKPQDELKTFSIAPHQAVLLAQTSAVRQGDTTKQIRLRLRNPQSQPNDDSSDLLFELNREVMEIGSGTKGLQVRSNPATGEIPDIQNPDQLHDIKWVPPIDDCLDGGVPFDRKLIDPENLRPDDSLAGVVLLDRGRLETSDVFRKLDGQAARYAFRKGNAQGEPRFQQALANGFRLRVPVQADAARLILRDDAGNKRYLVVGPYPGCPTEDGVPVVEVKVFNRELESILGFGTATGRLEDGDIDFLIFYQMSPVWSNLDAGDLVVPYTEDPGSGGDLKPCEPPRFSQMGG